MSLSILFTYIPIFCSLFHLFIHKKKRSPPGLDCSSPIQKATGLIGACQLKHLKGSVMSEEIHNQGYCILDHWGFEFLLDKRSISLKANTLTATHHQSFYMTFGNKDPLRQSAITKKDPGSSAIPHWGYKM